MHAAEMAMIRNTIRSTYYGILVGERRQIYMVSNTEACTISRANTQYHSLNSAFQMDMLAHKEYYCTKKASKRPRINCF